jgi:hypothetical protein
MSDDFEERLQSAIRRGQRRGQLHEQAAKAEQWTEEEFKRLHTRHRLQLSEQIEQAIERVAQHFPGFRTETLYGEIGWGAACFRDDLQLTAGKRSNLFSRLEMTIRPLSQYHVLDLRGKATVANKEYFHRNHFVPLQEADPEDFMRLIDNWAIDYAEYYASRQ